MKEKEYNLKTSSSGDIGITDIGFIAQEVEAVVPEVVNQVKI